MDKRKTEAFSEKQRALSMGRIKDWLCPKCANTVTCTKGGFGTHKRFCGDQTRFWNRVDKDGPNGCWLFMGARDKWGYGDLRWMNKHVQAHRLAWKLLRGDPGKMDCLHSCNNPPCCNPDHLYLGTDLENARDRLKAGTYNFGAKAYNAKLTEEQIREIRRSFKHTSLRRTNTAELAEKYGVARNYINNVVARRTWKYLV